MNKFFKVTPWILGIFLAGTTGVFAQKAPLDHSVYDTWESLGQSGMTKDGKIVYFTVNQQEGDSKLYLKDNKNNTLLVLDRASSVQLSHNEKYLVTLVKPTHAETREARIKKKRPDQMPKDTLAIVDLKTYQVNKIPAVKSFRLIEENDQFLAYMADVPAKNASTQNANGNANAERPAAAGNSRSGGGNSPRTESKLFIYNFTAGVDTMFERIDTYQFNKNGDKMVYVRKAADKDSIAADAGLFIYDVAGKQSVKVSGGKGEYKSIALNEDENQLAFLAYKGDDKALFKPHSLYHYQMGADSAVIIADMNKAGIPQNWHVGASGSVRFSKDGEKIFFGIAPIPLQKDTTLVDFEHAKVDIWHWKEDYLQPMQLVNLRRDQNQTYTAVINAKQPSRVIPLADEKMDIRLSTDTDLDYAIGTSDFGRRVETQWMTGSYQDIYLVNINDGSRKMIRENFRGTVLMSPKGNYVLFYERSNGNWFAYEIASGNTKTLNEGVSVSFANEDNDSPDDPNSYGIVGWNENETEVYLNDKYDIWAFNLQNGHSRMITNGYGRANNITLRYQRIPVFGEETVSFMGGRFGMGGSDPIDFTKPAILSAFDHKTKMNGFYRTSNRAGRNPERIVLAPYNFSQLRMNEKGDVWVYTKENYENSPNLMVSGKDFKNEVAFSNTNPQQANYNWGTAELFTWTTPKGYPGEGILYLPEDFDPNKKYPVIAYFYEIVTNGLHRYEAPSPTPSRLNIPFFVSNGYIVLAPDVRYEIGYPGRSAEEYINSGMKALAEKPWVNEKALGIQGQSWGGYQVAHLITATDMYAAAWSGAPVVNMTSAYGGIRWDSGMNRQFQYERTQSRIGATLWEKPELYIENSPLFHFPKVKTPVAVMHNDEDGAVPWYQGIEMFTALRRLGKPVWLLNYNGDKHNLVQRQNRKDIQRRQLEFFDHFLKGKPAAPWIERGVPAIEKGINWGFGSN